MTTDAAADPSDVAGSTVDPRVGALYTAVADTVRGWDGVEAGTVVGRPAFLVGGVPFAVVSERGLVLAGLSPADRERLRTRWSALTFDAEGHDRTRVAADGGREPWPLVPVGGNDLVSLRRYLRLSYDGARASASR